MANQGSLNARPTWWRQASALALVPFAFLAWRTWFTCDDAYISFRYARHWVEGQGLVFNLGESPPVEGYSNFLWVLWTGLGLRLGADAASWANATSLVCGAILVALVTRFAEARAALGRVETTATALCVALAPPITLWSTGGLETLPCALCVFGAFAALAHDPEAPRAWRAGACALLAALLRADGVGWAALALCAATVDGGTRRAARAALQAACVLIAGVAAHALWRHGYHGEWIPHTARVKAGFGWERLERGARYLATLAIALPALVGIVLAAAVARGGRAPRLAWAAAVVLAGGALYAIHVGGDFMPMARLLVPAVPFVAVLCALVCATSRPMRAVALALVAGLPWPTLGFDLAPDAWRQRFHFRWNDALAISESAMARGMRERALAWVTLGRALALHTRPGESLVAGNVGALGYYTELWLHDPFGLVSPEVLEAAALRARASPGHDRAVPAEFFLPRRPTYFGAYVDAPGAPLPPPWIPWIERGRARVESFPLDPARGFAAGTELRLLRLVHDG